jgi:hypothetical protein
MLVRIVHFILGALLAGGGGWIAWTQRAGDVNIFPPVGGMPWLMIAAVLALSAGIVFLVSAVHPRPNRRARLAAEAAERDEKLGAAESYYSERSRAADRDWRSDDIPPPVTRAPAPLVEPVRAAPPPPPQAAPPPPPAAPPVAAQVTKPVAASMPQAAAAAMPFPATATLAPIPVAAEPPPAPVEAKAPPKVVERPAPIPPPVVAPAPVAHPPPVVAPTPAVASPPVLAPVATPAVASTDAFGAIRTALAAGKLEDAEKLLNEEREKADGLALAELTGLAGDHAAAAGRASNAKWLWRLALKRFGELSAMDTPAAKAVAESLRVAG